MSDSMHLENRSLSHHVCTCDVRLMLFVRACNDAGQLPSVFYV